MNKKIAQMHFCIRTNNHYPRCHLTCRAQNKILSRSLSLTVVNSKVFFILHHVDNSHRHILADPQRFPKLLSFSTSTLKFYNQNSILSIILNNFQKIAISFVNIVSPCYNSKYGKEHICINVSV